MAEYVKVAKLADLPEGGKVLVDVKGRSVAVFNVGGTFYAVENVCTHDGGPLVEGDLDGFEVECPRHGARFDVRTGRPLCLPAFEPIETYTVKVEGDDVLIEIA